MPVRNLSIYYRSAGNSQGETDFLLQHDSEYFLITTPIYSTEIFEGNRIFAAEPRMAD